MRLVVVLGTGTEVGKTWAAAQTLAALRTRGVSVAARKPAQSTDPSDPAPSDADVLAAASGEDPLAVCPGHRRYAVAMAPPMAATALGLPPFTVEDLTAEITWPTWTDIGVVETAGGVLSPAASDGTSLDLARSVGADEILLVADAGLGTINGVRLSLAAMAGGGAHQQRPTMVLLNRFDPADPLHRANRDVLAREGPGIVTDTGALVVRWTNDRASR